MSKLRVLFCSSSLDGGGSERQLWQLATQLSAEQFEKQIYLLHRRGPFLAKLPSNLPVHAFSDLHFESRFPGAMHRAQVRHLESVLRQEKIDVVYDRTFHMTLVTSKACRRVGVKRISVIVSPPSRDFIQGRERFRWFKYRVLQKAYRDPLAIAVANSSSVADDAIGFFRLSPTQLRVIPNPVDIDAVSAAAREPQQLPQLSESRCSDGSQAKQTVRLVVAGRMSAEKGHRLIIEAAELWERKRRKESAEDALRLPELHIDLIGDGPLCRELQDATKVAGLSEYVHFRGFQENPYPWIAAADFVCIPSSYEGLPNVALEAMALRIPVIATPCSDALVVLMGNQHQQRRGSLLATTSADALVVELIRLLNCSDAELAAQKEAAYNWVREHHGMTHWLTLMTQLIQELAQSPIRIPPPLHTN